MKLTQKLLRYLNRVFDKNPGATLALRLRYDGGMSWRIEDGVLTTEVINGTGAPLSVPLGGNLPAIGVLLGNGNGATTVFTVPAGFDPNHLRLTRHDWQGDWVMSPDQRENIARFSTLLGNAANWQWSNVTISNNAAIAPNGATAAEAMRDDGAVNSLGYLRQEYIVSVIETWTFSIYAKADTLSKVRVFLGAGAGEAASVTVDLLTGQILAGAGHVEVRSDGWVRIGVTGLLGLGNWFGTMALVDDPGTTDGLFLWGAQMERGDSMRPFVFTNMGAATTTHRDYTVAGQNVTIPGYDILATGASITFDDLRSPDEVEGTPFTIATLAAYLAAQPGYSVPYHNSGDLAGMSALALMDGEGDQDASNGDHLTVYTSLLWAYLEAQARELMLAHQQGLNALQQMSIPTAEGQWLDEHGSYYGVLRRLGEPDALYGARIITEVLRPKGNNKAIELAIAEATGVNVARVVDVPDVTNFVTPNRAGYTFFNSQYRHNQDGALASYGLFDVTYGYDLVSGESMEGFAATVAAVVNRLRDAGTHLRQISFEGVLQDTVSVLGLSDTLQVETAFDLTETYPSGKKHNGEYRRDGSRLLLLDGRFVLDGSEEVDGIGPAGALILFNQSFDNMTMVGTMDAMSDTYTMLSGPFVLDGSFALDGGHTLMGENDAIFLSPPI